MQENFKVPFVKIFTSMRVMDDVAGGISTFYAEILRIKDMAEYVTGENDGFRHFVLLMRYLRVQIQPTE